MFLRSLAALGWISALGWVPAAHARSAEQCDVRTSIASPDQTAINFREGPSRTARKLFDLPSDALVEVHVTGSKGEWFQIDGIDDAELDKPIERGRWWVHRSQLMLSVAGGYHYLYDAPVALAAKLMRLTPDGHMLELRACRGEWVQVVVDERKTGWMAPDAQCSSPMTTCN